LDKKNFPRTGQQGQAFTRDQIQSIILHSHHTSAQDCGNNNRLKVGNVLAFSFRQGNVARQQQNRGLSFFFLSSFGIQKRGHTPYHWEFSRLEKSVRFKPSHCWNQDQSKQAGEWPSWHRDKTESHRGFLFESNVDFCQPTLSFLSLLFSVSVFSYIVM
jgi:hypothetical protein